MSLVELPPITAASLLSMPGGERYELVNGQLRERHVGQESSWIAGEIYRRLTNFVIDTQLGWVLPRGTSFQCFPWEHDRVRRFDASFIRRERMPEGPTQVGSTRIAPDFAIEVVSPNDSFYDVESKVDDFLNSGVRLIWVINPDLRRMTVYTPDCRNTPRKYSESVTLMAAPVIGFACPIAELFPKKV